MCLLDIEQLANVLFIILDLLVDGICTIRMSSTSALPSDMALGSA